MIGDNSEMATARFDGRIRAVIFDLDDTLVSASKVKWAHLTAVAQECYGLSVDQEHLQSQWGKPLLQQVTAIFGTIDSPENIYANLAAATPRFPKTAMPGAIPAVDALLAAGLQVGVVTSTPGSYASDDLRRLGFARDEFAFVHGEEDVLHHKPDPLAFEPGLEVLKTMGINREEVVYVGDLVMDHHAASNAGLWFIGVTSGLASAADFHESGAHVVVQDISNAAQLVTTNSLPMPAVSNLRLI